MDRITPTKRTARVMEQGRTQGRADARRSMSVEIADRIVAARERVVTTGDMFSAAYLAAYQQVRAFRRARLVGAIVQERHQQYSYALIDPLEHRDHGSIAMIVVWAVTFGLSGPHTYVFVADDMGNPLPEVPRLFHIPGANVARALAYIGYAAVG